MSEKKVKDLPFGLEQVLDLTCPNWRDYARDRISFNIPCPECNKSNLRDMKLNINFDKQLWRCPKCGNGGNAVYLYTFFKDGTAQKLRGPKYGELVDEIAEKLSDGNIVVQKRDTPKMKYAPILSDKELDKTFRALLAEPAFALSDEHKANLLARGMDEEVIAVNQYRTIPGYALARKFVNDAQFEYFKKKELGKVKEETPGLKYQSNLYVMLGMAIAKNLRDKGCKVSGVPGFFRFAGRYDCFYIPCAGILIPTRNTEGQIVGLQLRTDKGRTRYLTISSKNYDGGVLDGIMRAHWCLGDDSLDVYAEEDRPEVILTEGPLKADVALHLLRKSGYNGNVAFVAIPGVQTTAAFLEDCKTLKAKGFQAITVAFDMDKCTNINVMRGSKKLKAQVTDIGLRFKTLFWDEPGAERRKKEIMKLLAENDVKVPEDKVPDNIFYAVAALTTLLESNGIDHEPKWYKATKGIDDFLYWKAQNAEKNSNKEEAR